MKSQMLPMVIEKLPWDGIEFSRTFSTLRRTEMDKKPGAAAVHYGDLRGEAAADIADNLSSLHDLALKLGFRKGWPVGIRIYSSTGASRSEPGKVTVTVQVTEGAGFDDIEKRAAAENGELPVTEYVRTNVDIVDLLECFKRFEIGLFSKMHNVCTLRVHDTIDLEEASDG